jgi:hypothetical protein
MPETNAWVWCVLFISSAVTISILGCTWIDGIYNAKHRR